MIVLAEYEVATAIFPKVLHDEIEESQAINGFDGVTYSAGTIKVYGQTIANQTLLDTIIASHDSTGLVHFKELKIQKIDAKSEKLINDGFMFDNVRFSLSHNAQLNLIGLYHSRDATVMQYPISYNSKDDTIVYAISDAATLEAIYFTAFGAKKSILDAGTALKQQVRDATTVAEINAVHDNR